MCAVLIFLDQIISGLVDTNLTLTSLCSEQPLKLLFVQGQEGIAGVYIIFLILFLYKHKLFYKQTPTIYVWTINQKDVKIFISKMLFIEP